eukprot:scaffold362_cov176-Amphora_coffeaeformis.AAC.23
MKASLPFDGNGHAAKHAMTVRKRPRECAKLQPHLEQSTSEMMVYQQPHQPCRRGRRFPPIVSLTEALLFALLICVSTAAANEEVNWLSQDSVVLIVGATTSLLGSEVALALHRLFACHVVLIDDLTSDKSNGLVEGLSAMEFHRQSLFRVWQELDDHLTLYRMNPRPIVPDIDSSVDRLAHVFDKHQPTHVLIFPETPECFRGETDEAPPRAGMLEGLLEQVRSFDDTHPDAVRPRVVWTSSEEVYPLTGVWSESDIPPMSQNKEGGDAMVNEVIAQAYDKKGVSSVALRISKHIYGPFQEPSSPLFGIMENVLRKVESTANIPNVGDYLYVDDAVDAVLAALQLPNMPRTFALNVASGNSPLTLEQVLHQVQRIALGEEAEVIQGDGRRLRFSLAEQVLNFHPRVSLTEGLKRTLAWHFDRMYPYGAGETSLPAIHSMVRTLGIASCSDASDTECLRGVPILPCASECAHRDQCRNTTWDGLLPKLESWTSSCPSVLYTVRREASSKAFGVSPRSNSLWPDRHCNIAFIPSSSPGELKIEDDWTIVPVQIDLSDIDAWLVPLWSPGKLFPRSKWAIYTSPNVVWDDLNNLMEAVHVQPEGASGAVALLVGTGDLQDRLRNPSQRQAYRAIHIKATEFLDPDELHDGFTSNVDAESWMVHRLRDPDAEQLRCDVSKEIGGWKGVVDFHAAASFVFGLHDLWSQVLLHEKGRAPWWHGDSVVTVPQEETKHRRLKEQNSDISKDVEAQTGDENVVFGNPEQDVSDAVETDGDEDEEELHEVHHFDHNGFGVTRKSIGAAMNVDDSKKQEGDDNGADDDDEEEAETDDEPEPHSDPSENDTWLGVLSSTDTCMFVRLVSPDSVGAVFLDEYGSFSKT